MYKRKATGGKTSTWNGGDAGGSGGGRGGVVGGCPLSFSPLFLFTVTLGQFFRCSLSLFCYSSSSVFFFSFLPLFYNPSLTLFSAFLSLSVPLQKLGSLSLPHGFLSIICQPSPLFFSSSFFSPSLPPAVLPPFIAREHVFFFFSSWGHTAAGRAWLSRRASLSFGGAVGGRPIGGLEGPTP